MCGNIHQSIRLLPWWLEFKWWTIIAKTIIWYLFHVFFYFVIINHEIHRFIVCVCCCYYCCYCFCIRKLLQYFPFSNAFFFSSIRFIELNHVEEEKNNNEIDIGQCVCVYLHCEKLKSKRNEKNRQEQTPASKKSQRLPQPIYIIQLFFNSSFAICAVWF